MYVKNSGHMNQQGGKRNYRKNRTAEKAGTKHFHKNNRKEKQNKKLSFATRIRRYTSSGNKKRTNITKRTTRYTPLQINPSDPNMQVTPYKGHHRTEYDVRLFKDPEPQSRAEKRREELALGIYKTQQPTIL